MTVTVLLVGEVTSIILIQRNDMHIFSILTTCHYQYYLFFFKILDVITERLSLTYYLQNSRKEVFVSVTPTSSLKFVKKPTVQSISKSGINLFVINLLFKNNNLCCCEIITVAGVVNWASVESKQHKQRGQIYILLVAAWKIKIAKFDQRN